MTKSKKRTEVRTTRIERDCLFKAPPHLGHPLIREHIIDAVDEKSKMLNHRDRRNGDSILIKYGVQMDRKVLTVQAETDYFSPRIRNLVRAMLEVERAAAGIETTLTCGPTSGDHQ